MSASTRPTASARSITPAQRFVEVAWGLWQQVTTDPVDEPLACIVEAEAGLRRTRLAVGLQATAGVVDAVTMLPARAVAPADSDEQDIPYPSLRVDFVSRRDVPSAMLVALTDAGLPTDALRAPVAAVLVGGHARPADDAEMTMIALVLAAVRAVRADAGAAEERRRLRGSFGVAGGTGRWRVALRRTRRRRRSVVSEVAELPGAAGIAGVSVGFVPWPLVDRARELGCVDNELPLAVPLGDGLPAVVLECSAGGTTRLVREIMRLRPAGVVVDGDDDAGVLALLTERGLRLLARTPPHDEAVEAFARRREALMGYHAVVVRDAQDERPDAARLLMCCFTDTPPRWGARSLG